MSCSQPLWSCKLTISFWLPSLTPLPCDRHVFHLLLNLLDLLSARIWNVPSISTTFFDTRQSVESFDVMGCFMRKQTVRKFSFPTLVSDACFAYQLQLLSCHMPDASYARLKDHSLHLLPDVACDVMMQVFSWRSCESCAMLTRKK